MSEQAHSSQSERAIIVEGAGAVAGVEPGGKPRRALVILQHALDAARGRS